MNNLIAQSTDEKKIAKKAGAFSSLLSLVGIEKKVCREHCPHTRTALAECLGSSHQW
jgi:hypothetical protein